jgi:hypothetical protein
MEKASTDNYVDDAFQPDRKIFHGDAPFYAMLRPLGGDPKSTNTKS